jgi:hypothetical protein
MNGNSYEYINCLALIYQREANIEDSKKKLEDKSVSISGAEALRLSYKMGKGWLALLLSEKLVYNTFIPDYILNAIAFASAHMDSSSKYKSVFYRLKAISNHEKHNKNKDAKEFSFKDKSEVEVIKEFCEKFSDDQLTIFLSKL